MNVTRSRRWLSLVTVAVGIAVPSLAAAGPVANLATAVAHVSIIVPPIEDPILVEAISRVRSELRVVGLDSQSAGCDAEGAQDAHACADSALKRPSDPPAEQTPRSPGVATALISLAREDGVVTIEVIERLANGSKFFRLVYVPLREGGGDPSVLAVRSVELLRDVHLDVERSEASPKLVTAPPPPIVAALPVLPPQPVVEPGPWRIGVTAGLLQGRNGLGPRLAPALGVARALGPHLTALALASGPFYEDLTSAAGETAATRQELGLVGLRGELETRWIRPFGTVAVGAFHMTASGTSSSPTTVARASSLWAVLGTVGAGGAFKVTRFIDLVAEADLLLAGPAGEVTIRNAVVGTAGAPSVLFQTGLWIALP